MEPVGDEGKVFMFVNVKLEYLVLRILIQPVLSARCEDKIRPRYLCHTLWARKFPDESVSTEQVL